MKKLLVVIFITALSILSAQTNSNNLLNIPERGENAVEGSDFMESIKNLSLLKFILNKVTLGHLPNKCKFLKEIATKKRSSPGSISSSWPLILRTFSRT